MTWTNGTFVPWWTNSSLNEFRKTNECFQKYFDGLTIGPFVFDGKLISVRSLSSRIQSSTSIAFYTWPWLKPVQDYVCYHIAWQDITMVETRRDHGPGTVENGIYMFSGSPHNSTRSLWVSRPLKRHINVRVLVYSEFVLNRTLKRAQIMLRA